MGCASGGGMCTMSLMALMAALNPIQTAKASESLPHGLLVVTIDCLPAWMLSAWGATWVATPSMDTLAARGIVLDRLITPSLDPRSAIDDLFGGFGKDSLFESAAAAGWRTAILSDDPATPDRVALASGCGQSVDVWEVPAVATRSPAARNSETNLARLFSQAREVIIAGKHQCVWCHAGSLGVSWDAPDIFRESYIDAEDPPPPPGAGVPYFTVDASTNPDLVMGVRQVFAGQLTLLDFWLGRLLESVQSTAANGKHWGVLVMGVRGLPLGLHGTVGCLPACTDAAGKNQWLGLPYGERVHVPAVFVDPVGWMACQRYGGLVVPADLGATLQDLIAAPCDALSRRGRSLTALLESSDVPARDRVVVMAQDGAALITPGWHLLLERPEAAQPARLFAKPDDFFELSDVANRCPGITEEMQAALESAWQGDLERAWQTPLSPEVIGGLAPF